MAAKNLSRVLSSSTTGVFRKSPSSYLRPALANTQLSPTVRGLATEWKMRVPNFGADGNHWLIRLKKPEGNPTREQIIDSYVKILATVLGSEEEARMKIYSVSTKHYFAIGALIDKEISDKLKELPQVDGVGEDTYIDAEKKDYGGEPFIDGQPVPYDRKYHALYWRTQEAAIYPRMDDHMDAEIGATDSEIPVMDADSKLSTPRAWLSRVVSWWKGPSP